MAEDIDKNGEVSEELIKHFRCGECNKWWSIGDAPKERKEWFCPWCGISQSVENKSNE